MWAYFPLEKPWTLIEWIVYVVVSLVKKAVVGAFRIAYRKIEVVE